MKNAFHLNFIWLAIHLELDDGIFFTGYDIFLVIIKL